MPRKEPIISFSKIMEEPSSIRGKLQSTEQARGAIIAVISCHCPHCNGPVEERISLPEEYSRELSTLAGKNVLIVRAGHGYTIATAEAA